MRALIQTSPRAPLYALWLSQGAVQKSSAAGMPHTDPVLGPAGGCHRWGVWGAVGVLAAGRGSSAAGRDSSKGDNRGTWFASRSIGIS